jgi:deoxyribonuclease V
VVCAAASEERIVRLAAAQPYRSGMFFERELPCLVAVLSAVQTRVKAIVIDGYVVLDEHGGPGLGAHLFAHSSGAIPVIGVAKTAYRGSAFAIPVYRGSSRRPLFITAAGVATADAARLVSAMHGVHRLPTLISRVDRLAREGVMPLSKQFD